MELHGRFLVLHPHHILVAVIAFVFWALALIVLNKVLNWHICRVLGENLEETQAAVQFIESHRVERIARAAREKAEAEYETQWLAPRPPLEDVTEDLL